MKKLFECLDCTDHENSLVRERYPIKEIIVIIFSAVLANADDWVSVEQWANAHKEQLARYLKLRNGIPSHGTLQRIMGMIDPDFLLDAKQKWIRMNAMEEEERLKRIICIDDACLRRNSGKGKAQKSIALACCKGNCYSLERRTEAENCGESSEIAECIAMLNTKRAVITVNAAETQPAIAEKIKDRTCDYVLAVKKNQKKLYKEIKLYFKDEAHLKNIKKKGDFYLTAGNSHGFSEILEFYQTGRISFLKEKDKWDSIKSIGMVVHKIGEMRVCSYFIASFSPDIGLFYRAVKGNWAADTQKWRMEVTFREKEQTALYKTADENLQIIRKWCLTLMKQANFKNANVSIRKKRALVSSEPEKYLDYVLSL